MIKPDWKNAPEWANYLALDGDGDESPWEWYWYEKKPEWRSEYSIWDDFDLGKAEKANPSGLASESLEERPHD